MTKLCILCQKQLYDGQPTNREHYVPATAIRQFDKLRIPKHWTHALRIDLREGGGEKLLCPISQHKKWAIIVTHTKCNSDASHMCVDMSYIIKNPHNYPPHKENSIREYYEYIWKKRDSVFVNLGNATVDEFYKDKDMELIYMPGTLSIGKILLVCGEEKVFTDDYEKHYTFLGTEKALKSFLKEND